MQLNNFSIERKKRKRIGRGGKRGSFSGRGIKGQKSRAGRKIRPAERDLIMRLPKLRGYRNKPKGEKPRTVSVGELERRNITIANRATLGNAKILGNGELTKQITVVGIPVSKTAREKILKAHGTIS
ncbi:MAG: uL15 family ribosomal protein [Candidatus Liptonbacteria bacterium]|nr:uL15 family ribosomal protein [Candidatus Liptonbacteria bacterium]